MTINDLKKKIEHIIKFLFDRDVNGLPNNVYIGLLFKCTRTNDNVSSNCQIIDIMYNTFITDDSFISIFIRYTGIVTAIAGVTILIEKTIDVANYTLDAMVDIIYYSINKNGNVLELPSNLINNENFSELPIVQKVEDIIQKVKKDKKVKKRKNTLKNTKKKYKSL